ncbi:DUF6153 family protein [Streptomyces sp. NL15-2K]|uniref:DUF6153 family protein n=1 Tax=Streptomyces sp. NL15-2K TaxID=376149 RepID=UPI000F5877FC|nr:MULTISPECIES: DUF6153 family protein [Actinomycetes]WKX12571.1 DUF6153 family protein [Kutzneria buriramensis]GCB44007.1 hypothetical protein SNL152K_1292 [Streptomyces sp. NL15-2K]
MTASRHVRTGGALGHLLLVVVLALGVFTMHTLGHPDSSHDSATNTASHATAMDATAADHTPMSSPADTEAGMSSHTTDPRDPSSSHEPGAAMDMLSLCLAVLFGAWVLAALLRSAFARYGERPAELLAQVAAVLRPSPPPRGPDLTRLSVLRL